MLPAWFLTFRYQQKPYTILVNGQTGKVVGGVPYNKSKVAVCFILTGLAVSFFAFLIIYGLFLMNMIDSPGKFVFDVLIVTGIFVGIGIAKFHKVKKSVELTESKTTDSYVKDRQEGI